MPGDTLVLNNKSDTVAPADTLYAGQIAALPIRVTEEPDSGPGLVLLGLFIIITPFIYRRVTQKIRKTKAVKAALADMASNFVQYDNLLTQYNGYYRSLPDVYRRRFVERVVRFMTTKTFTCMDLPAADEMPLLISAASVQISFGLNKYLLDFFDTVYILQHNYNYGFYQKPFEGHVNADGIYLSWDNFRRGFQNYYDGDNVGIHEMAHALAYVNFMAGANDGQDEAFIRRFYAFSDVARPIFNAMQNGETNLLNNYAATNYNEFWAVAVETFFEKSLQMKLEMPDLYTSLCSLLNQDPLQPEKILHDGGLDK